MVTSRRRTAPISALVAAALLSIVLAACGATGTDDVSVGTAASGGSSGFTEPDDPADLDDPVGDDAAVYEWYGLSKDEAIAKAESEDRPWRVAREDGESFFLTDDLIIGRLNFYIDAATVTYTDIESEDGVDGEGAQDPDDAIYMGLTEDEAGALADENDRPWRIIRNGDESFAITMDFSPDRLNFELDGGVVTVVTRG